MALTSINIYTIKQVRTNPRRFDIENCQITNPSSCYRALQLILDLKSEPVEKFGIISINSKSKINGIHIISIGTLNHIYVQPRDVFMAAMMNNARAIIAFHNHVSGNPSPSQDDIKLTLRLKEAGNLLGIELLDHLITGEGEYVSLRESGEM